MNVRLDYLVYFPNIGKFLASRFATIDDAINAARESGDHCAVIRKAKTVAIVNADGSVRYPR